MEITGCYFLTIIKSLIHSLYVTIKFLLLGANLLILSGCASTSWTSRIEVDEFTDTRICKIRYGSAFSQGFNKGLGGIHYYPFIEKVGDNVIFGIHNDYNIPVGDVQIRIDKHPAILISYTETPVFYSTNKQNVDLSYLKNIEGIDHQAMQESIDASMSNIDKISSPFTATTGSKAAKIIKQMRTGKELKMRVIGFGTNSVKSTRGEYKLNEQLRSSLEACGI